MCDYSGMHLQSHLAAEGEELSSYKLNHGTVGLASHENVSKFRQTNDDRCLNACCVAPGASLQLNLSKAAQEHYGVPAQVEVKFDQVSANSNEFRDGVRFPNNEGVVVRLVELYQVGGPFTAKVVSLGAAQEMTEHPEARQFATVRR